MPIDLVLYINRQCPGILDNHSLFGLVCLTILSMSLFIPESSFPAQQYHYHCQGWLRFNKTDLIITIVILNLLWSELAEMNERRFDLLLHIYDSWSREQYIPLFKSTWKKQNLMNYKLWFYF